MSLADDFLRDAGVTQQAPTSLSDQFTLDAQGPQPLPQRPATLQPPQPLSLMDRLLSHVPDLVGANDQARMQRFVAGAAKLPVGGAQLVANMLPDSTNIPQTVNQAISDKYRSLPAKPAGDLIDNMSLGELASPANLMVGGGTAPVTTAAGRAILGAKMGGMNGLLTPVDTTTTGGKYWTPKGVETGVGAIGGAVLAPLVGAVTDRVAGYINKLAMTPMAAAKNADALIEKALEETGQKPQDIPPDQLNTIKAQVQNALSQGKRLDAAAALRKSDFAAENITPTLGQVTRDPTQWSEELNVRGVVPVGRPLMLTMQEGNRAVSQGIGQYGADASEPATASQKLAQALKNYDVQKQGDIASAYATARASAGKDLELPTQGLQDTYKQVLGDFADKIPTAVRNKFEALQGGPLTFEGADNLRKVINDHVTNDPPTNKALGILRSALNNAQSQAADGGGPFAPAVKLAAQRFGEHEAIPALAEAANGPVSDNFVRQQIINNPSTEQVQKLAALLKQQAPDAYQEARAQIGAQLSNAAFGQNVANDKTVAQESYNRALSKLGTGKLNAFFEPNEVEQLKRLGRIAAYQVSTPAASNANYSNTASALANLLRLGGHIPMMKGPMQLAGDKVVVNNALNANVPLSPNLTDSQRLMLSKLLAGSGPLGLGIGTRLLGGAGVAGSGSQ